MGLASIDPFVSAAEWAYPAFDLAGKPESQSFLPLAGAAADKAVHADLGHCQIQFAGRLVFHLSSPDLDAGANRAWSGWSEKSARGGLRDS
jgi:hypothetical protein